MERQASFVQDRIQKRNCFWIFSLQTGIQMLIVVDFFAFIALISLFFTVTLEDIRSNNGRVGYIAFEIITDGIIILLFGCKCYTGFNFIAYSCFESKTKVKSRSTTMRGRTVVSDNILNQQKDDSVNYNDAIHHMDKFKMMKTKNERKQLNNYFIFSVVTYCFTVIQNLSLIFIFLFESDKLIKVGVLAGCAVMALIYVQKKIYQLLQEKDTELRFRSIKRGVDQIDTLGSEDDRDSERGGSRRGSMYKPPEENKQGSEENTTNKSYKFRNQME